MKSKSFKTRTNNGSIVKVTVVYIEKQDESREDAVIIETRRVVPADMFSSYNRLNRAFPAYLIVKQTENYAILYTRSASMKVSTFNQISEVISELASTL